MDSNRLEYAVGEVDDCGEDEEDMPMSWVDIDIEGNSQSPASTDSPYAGKYSLPEGGIVAQSLPHPTSFVTTSIYNSCSRTPARDGNKL